MNSTNTTATSISELDQDLARLFGSSVSSTPLSTNDRMGRRIHGIDLTSPLSEEQAQREAQEATS